MKHKSVTRTVDSYSHLRPIERERLVAFEKQMYFELTENKFTLPLLAEMAREINSKILV